MIRIIKQNNVAKIYSNDKKIVSITIDQLIDIIKNKRNSKLMFSEDCVMWDVKDKEVI